MANPVADKFKVWAFPGLISVLAAIIWNDVKEIKSDVKALIAQSAIDKTRIDALERELYGKKTAMNTSQGENTPDPDTTVFKVFGVLVVRPEEEYSYKKLRNIQNTSL